ncbi:PASTA domain-containing protein [Blattabacterium cuenoti]|uniref:PASTA domain-containing protein n=5 Tax=Blattabacterium cuenoti TaxID=1653831 RepID=UPI00311E4A7F
MNYSKYFIIFIINFLVSILILYKITQLSLKWIDVYTKHGSYVVVPDLIGFTLPKSMLILKKLGLKYDIDTSRYDPNFRINQIISFSPEAGDHVKEGRYVYIQVNSKSSQSVLPNVINKEKKIAIKLLHASHISVKEIRYINDRRKDTVLKVLYQNKSIQFGYRFSFNPDGIILIIGKGYKKDNFLVPNVVGMSLNSAIYTLKNQLFHVINFYYDHIITNPDKNAKVYRQKPDSGIIYDKNKPVELWLTSKELLDQFIQIKENNLKNEVKNQDLKNEVKNQDLKNEVKNQDLKNKVKNQDLKNEVKNQDLKNKVKNQDLKNKVKNQDLKNKVKNQDLKNKVKNQDLKNKVKNQDLKNEKNSNCCKTRSKRNSH